MAFPEASELGAAEGPVLSLGADVDPGSQGWALCLQGSGGNAALRPTSNQTGRQALPLLIYQVRSEQVKLGYEDWGGEAPSPEPARMPYLTCFVAWSWKKT